jgi:hypothetical protein
MITGNEPAMPNVAFDNEGTFTHLESEGHCGLTIRQQFAAMAMASDDYEAPYLDAYEHRAKHWLAKADALIKELNKTE